MPTKPKVYLGEILLTLLASGFNTSSASADFIPPLPAALVDTSMPVQSGTVHTVEPTNNCNGPSGLQAKIDAANLGDTVVIPAGTSCIGTYRLRNKTSGSGWIVIRSSRASELPIADRIQRSEVSKLAKISTPANGVSAFSTDSGAHHYRLIGLEIASSPDAGIVYNIVLLAANTNPPTLQSLPHHIIIDRCYIHGHRRVETTRGVFFEGSHLALINSRIDEIHVLGFDTQAIGASNGAGPFNITNNYLEASGENIMFGGAATYSDELMPKDIVVQRNYLYKPWWWKFNSGSTLPAVCRFDSSYSEWGELFELINGNTKTVYQCKNSDGLSPQGFSVN